MARKFTYPSARRDDVVDDYHGNPVPDPYRWLEDPESGDTRAFINAQNELTQSYLAEIPARAFLKQRLTELWNFPKTFPPTIVDGKIFYQYNDGLQNQPVLYVKDSLDGEPRQVLDPNTFSDDGTIALINTSFTEDGRLLAYTTSISGSDRQDVHVWDIEKGEKLPDVITFGRFTSVTWLKDGSGFYYNRYPDPATVEPENAQRNMMIYLHKLGTPQEDDQLIYSDPENPDFMFYPGLTDDDRYLAMYVGLGAINRNRFYYAHVDDNGMIQGEFIRLIDVDEADYTFLGNVGSVFYFRTDLDAPRGRIIAIDTEYPDRQNWRTVVPQGEDVITYTIISGDKLVVVVQHKAYNRVFLYTLEGELVRELEMPTIGSILMATSKQTQKDIFFLFHSYLYPPTVLRYDTESDELTVFAQPDINFDPDGYETRQVSYTSTDGTPVTMFMTHKKGLEKTGDIPTVLYGYGGFNISLLPGFSVSALSIIEKGGIYAVANLRGGGEYGEEWHEAGMLGKKQNVFNDFISAAEYLINEGYTRRERLAIMGGSNGGLLVSACMLQRPDLFGAVVCQVPVTDMFRYHKFTAGRYWVPEYGNAEENPEHFAFLRQYSPLHNVKENVTYPPMYLHTAESDDRVVPMHALKYVATIQAADMGENPLLLNLETKAGHGFGKPTSKLIEQYTDIYAFIFQQFGVT